MKIEVKTVRECCAPEDLQPVVGPGQPKKETGRVPEWMFCKHCGRHHRYGTFMDPAGSTDWGYYPQPYPWAKEETR